VFQHLPSTEELEEGTEQSDRPKERYGAVSVQETANGPWLFSQQRQHSGQIQMEKADGE